MFKVNDINKAKELNSTKATKKVGGGGSFSAYLSESMKAESGQVANVGSISVADAIFATQMVNGEEEREIKKKLLKKASTFIDKLEEIRDGLLVGYISKDKLIDISRMIKERQVETTDERLKNLMEEIELRVEVELAKLMR